MITTTLPNVVEPAVNWTPPVSQRHARRLYSLALADAVCAIADEPTADADLIATLCTEAVDGRRLIDGSVERW